MIRGSFVGFERSGIDVVQPGLPGVLSLLLVHATGERVDGQPDRIAEDVAPEETVEPVLRPQPDEVRVKVVDHRVLGARAGQADLHGVILGHRIRQPERPAQSQEGLRRLRRLWAVSCCIGGRAAGEVTQILPEGVLVEVGVLVSAVILVFPVFNEDSAVDIAVMGPSAIARFDDVLQLVEPAVLALDPGDEVVTS